MIIIKIIMCLVSVAVANYGLTQFAVTKSPYHGVMVFLGTIFAFLFGLATVLKLMESQKYPDDYSGEQ